MCSNTNENRGRNWEDPDLTSEATVYELVLGYKLYISLILSWLVAFRARNVWGLWFLTLFLYSLLYSLSSSAWKLDVRTRLKLRFKSTTLVGQLPCPAHALRQPLRKAFQPGKPLICLSGLALAFSPVLICETREFLPKILLSFVCEIYHLDSIGKGFRSHWLRWLFEALYFSKPIPLTLAMWTKCSIKRLDKCLLWKLRTENVYESWNSLKIKILKGFSVKSIESGHFPLSNMPLAHLQQHYFIPHIPDKVFWWLLSCSVKHLELLEGKYNINAD